jgi:class 3 adenylate cyclase
MNLDDRLGAVFAGRLDRGSRLARARADSAIIPMHSLQGVLRPMFGKGPPREPDIGDHPDFRRLKGTTDKVYAPISTLFMDVESSTRLGLLYPPEDVYNIKNAFICAASEIVRAFDGHVHRLQGDAVIAYFGRLGAPPEHGVVDALNCSAALQYFAEYVVVPRLEDEGFTESQFGIRVGVDFGPKNAVLWGSYGYPGMDEVTATSLFVDSAAKLQHAAGRNQVMLGQSLVDFIDFPSGLVSTRTVQRDGKQVEEPYLMPNHTNAAGEPRNYRQYVLDWEGYLSLTRFGLERTSLRLATALGVSVDRHRDGNRAPYLPASTTLSKGDGLTFTVTLPPLRALDKVVFAVENHGTEAKAAGERTGSKPYQNHETPYVIRNTPTSISHNETAGYRGLHYMTVTASADGRPVYSTRVGVFVE